MKRLVIVVLAALALVGGTAFAQTPPDTPRGTQQAIRVTELALRDGSRMYGTVVSESDTEIVFRTQSGTTMTVTRNEVLSIRPVDGVLTGGEFQPSDPNVTRLFFGPTGRSLKRGQVYLGVYELFLPFVQVGVTDRISIGGGTPLMFLSGEGASDRPFWITPKVQVFSGAKTQISVGVFHGFSGDGYGGIGYVVGTHGTAASSFTIGAGAGYANDGGSAGVVMLGGEAQVRRNMKLITENYVWEGGDGVLSGGVRFFGERISADLALIAPIGANGFFLGPLVNFVYIF